MGTRRAVRAAVTLVALFAGGLGGVGTAATTATTAAAEVASPASAGCGASTLVPGTQTVTTSSGGVARSYIRHVPPGHDGTTPLPLVIAIHGYAEGAQIHTITTQYQPLADAEGFVTVFPQALGNPAAWNPALGGADVAYVTQVLDEIEAAACIDTSRVFVSGYSMGAFMTSSLACTLADRVAAVAPVAGLRNPAGCAPARPIPLLSFHGTVDPLVPFSTVPGPIAAWAARNGCDPAPVETPAGGDDVATIARVTYACEGGDAAPVELYRIDGGGHGWPGSEFSKSLESTEIAPLFGYTTMEIDATALIWSFFEANPMPVEDPPPATSGTFRALTYNVAGLPEPLSGSEPDINTPLISPLLNAYDLVLVQEDWANPDPPLPGASVYHHLLVADADHPYQSTPAPVPLGTNPVRPTALLSDGLNRLSRFGFGTVTRVMWPSCFGGADTSDGGAADCLAEKGFSVATTELAPGAVVDVYNLHAEAGNTSLDIEARAEDFAILAAYIAEHSAGRAVIVGGDFNLHSDRAADGAIHREFLRATGLTDVCEAVDCGADVHRIDKFAFRGGDGVVLEATTHRFERDVFVRSSDGAALSDHDALAVTFAWALDPVAPGTVEGTVTTEAGAPVAGATVAAYRPTDGLAGLAATTTGPDGTYALAVPAGAYQIVFVPPAGSGLVMEWSGDTTRAATELVPVSAAGVAPAVDAALAGGGTIAGAVTGPAGPVAAVDVWAYRDTDGYVGTAIATTDAGGSYTLGGLLPSTYRILFAPPKATGLAPRWFDGATTRAAATPIMVGAGTSHVADATLTP